MNVDTCIDQDQTESKKAHRVLRRMKPQAHSSYMWKSFFQKRRKMGEFFGRQQKSYLFHPQKNNTMQQSLPCSTRELTITERCNVHINNEQRFQSWFIQELSIDMFF